MTKTAVCASSGKIFFPEKEFSTGAGKKELRDKYRSIKAFCPHCLRVRGQYEEVFYVDAKTRALHFRHRKNPNSECSQGDTESDKHALGKEFLVKAYESKGWTCHPEQRVLLPSGGHRRPDILVQGRFGQYAVEIQLSKAPVEELIRRTEDHRKAGMVATHWYLGDGCYGSRDSCSFRNYLENLKPRYNNKTERYNYYHIMFRKEMTVIEVTRGTPKVTQKDVRLKNTINDKCSKAVK